MTRVRLIPPALVATATLILTLVPLSPKVEAAPLLPVSSNVGCDPLDGSACLLPFPNNFFTTPDPATDTGRRVDFLPTAMPRNGTEVSEGGEGKPVEVLEWNRNDGFSPGSTVMTLVPGLDLHATWGTQDRAHSSEQPNEPGYFDHRDHIADIALYERPDAPIVIINADTGERHPFWSELDSHRDAVSQDERLLILRPAVNFEEGARYVVALRRLKTADGTTIEPGTDFAAYRSGEGSDATRQTYLDEEILQPLADAGVERDDLYLAWDFTIASERNLAGRMLHMRDDAFGILGDTDLADGVVQGSTPAFTVDSTSSKTDTFTDSRGVQHTHEIRVVHGRVTVPNYLDRIQQTEGHVRGNQLPFDAPVPGSRLLDLDLDGLPDQNPAEPTVNVPFQCEVPLNGEENLATLYGHGLLGTRSQVGDIKSPRRAGPFLGCGVDWWGMSTPDLPTIAAILADFSNFPSLPDRAQQGFLNFMFVGRAAVHPAGFATDPAFRQDNGESLVKVADAESTPLFYDGNSQGGIMGGSLIAVSPDIQRGILGVPGMNYSTLLNRSVDWEGELALEPDIPAYSVPFYESYRDPIERQVVFGLMQMLWDRGEANGFAAHMTDDPYPNTPPHEVMLQPAYSDHQVANVSAEVEARTIDAPIMLPGLGEGRHWEAEPYYTETATYPYDGSALVYWDSGNATPPNGNIPPDQNGDPHSHPRNEPAAAWQEAHFLMTGTMYDVCGGGDYLTLRHPANGGSASCHPPEWAAGSSPPDDETVTSHIAISEGSNTSGQFSDPTFMEAELTDGSGVPIEGAEVTFELAGASTRTFTATTGPDGLASVAPTLTERPGEYALSASFLGDDAHDASASDPVAFVVDREDTDTLLIVSGKGSKKALVASLLDSDSGEGVADRSIEFFANGDPIGSSTTDGEGNASIDLPPRYRGARHTFEARFSGDDFYRPSSGATST